MRGQGEQDEPIGRAQGIAPTMDGLPTAFRRHSIEEIIQLGKGCGMDGLPTAFRRHSRGDALCSPCPLMLLTLSSVVLHSFPYSYLLMMFTLTLL